MSRQVSDRLRKVVVRSLAAGVVFLGSGPVVAGEVTEPWSVTAEALAVAQPPTMPAEVVVAPTPRPMLGDTRAVVEALPGAAERPLLPEPLGEAVGPVVRQGLGTSAEVPARRVQAQPALPVITGALGVLSQPVISPSGSWRAVLEVGGTGSVAVWRAQGTAAWSRVGAPDGWAESVIAINDSGNLLLARRGSVLRSIGTTWQSPESVPEGSFWWVKPVAAAFNAASTAAVVALSDGSLIFTDGPTWGISAPEVSPAATGVVSVVGDNVFISSPGPSPGIYSMRRWSFATRSWLPVSGAPFGRATVAAVGGSTTQLLAVASEQEVTPPSSSHSFMWSPGLSVWRSSDAGATWSSVVVGEPMPARQRGVLWGSPRLGTDGRIRLFGDATPDNGVTRTSYEVSFDPVARTWSVPVRRDGLAGSPLTFPNQRVNGGLNGIVRWYQTGANPNVVVDVPPGGIADPIGVTSQTATAFAELNPLNAPLEAPRTSPSGAWAIAATADRQAIWRTNWDGTWQRIPRPESPVSVSAFGVGSGLAVLDDGTVLVVSREADGLSSSFNAYFFRNGEWFGPKTLAEGFGGSTTTEIAVGANNRVAVVGGGSGVLLSDDGGRSWRFDPNTTLSPPPVGARARIVGDVVHVVGANSYQRWSFTSGQRMLVNGVDALSLSSTPTLVVDWANPNSVRLAAVLPQGLAFWSSTDGGATFGAGSAPEPLPRGMVVSWMQQGPNGRLHLLGRAVGGAGVLVYATTHAAGPTPGFTPFVGLYLGESGVAELIDSSRLAETAAAPARVSAWVSDYDFDTNQSYLLIRDYGDASPESVFGFDAFGLIIDGVNAALGSFTTETVDLAIAGPGPALELRRTYNSADSRVGLFGRGWTSSLEVRLFENIVTNDAVILREDGGREYFAWTGTSFVAPPGYTSTLARTATGWTLAERSGASMTFRADGRLLSSRDADGMRLDYSWNAANELTTVTDATTGRFLSFTYTGRRIASASTNPVTSNGVTAPLTWNYAYNGNLLTRACEPRNNSTATGWCTTYGYTSGALTTVTDPNGNVDEAVGYVRGRVAWRENGAGDRTTFVYGPSSTVATNERGFSTSSTFDGQYRLVTETNARNGTTTHEYNAGGYRWRTTDPNGLVTTRTFDGNGNVLSERNGNNETTWYTYDAFNNRLTVRDGRSASATDNTFVVTTTWSGATRRRLSERTPATAQQPTGTLRTWGYTDGSEAAIGGGVMPVGLLETVTDPNGNVESYRYDSRGDLRETTSTLGLLTTFTYDELGRKLTETSFPTGFSTGVTTTFVYDGLGNVVRTEGPAVTNAVSNVVRRERTVITFDPAGNPVSTVVSDVGGSASPDAARTTLRTFDAADRPLTVTDPEGGVITNAYDVAGNLVQVTDARGVVGQFGFDANNMPTSEVVLAAVTDPGAATPRNVTMWTKVYDTAGRLTSSTDALGRTVQLAYDNANRQTSATLLGFDNRNGTLRNIVLEWVTFDAAGNPLTKATGNGLRAESFTYDQAGRLVSSTLDPTGLNRVTTLVYDRNGNVLTRTVSANGRTEQTRFTYNAANLPLTQTVENGTVDLVTRFGYDNRGLQTSTIEPRGNLAGATAANFRTDITYDGLGRQIRVQSPSVSVTTVNTGTGAATTTSLRPTVTTGYNTFGDQTHRRDERANTTVQSFDRLGRVVTITHPSYTPPGGTAIVPTEQMVYDANGNLTSKTDRRGEVTTWQFDGLNRAIRQTDPQVGTNPAGFSTVVYDDAGNQLVTIDQRGARIEFTYDDLNRVRTEVRVVRNGTPTPNRFTTTFDYDDLGNVTFQRTPTGDVSRAVFNAASEMTSSTDPGLFTTTYVRDVAGRVTRQTDPLGRRAETDYDLAGRAITVRNFDAAGVLMTTRTTGYDAAGNPTSYVSPRGNVAGATAAHFTTTVAYDALSRVTSVTEPTSATTSITTSYAYDAAGNISRLTDGRNNETLYAYQAWNLQSTVIEPSTTAHSAIAQRTWTTSFDAGGLPVRLVEPGPVTVNRVFDDLGRLTSETGSGTGAVSATRTMGYDPVGLVTSVNAPGGAITFSFDDRRLLTGSDGPATALDSSFTYDASGRLLSRTDASGASVFTWNSRGLLATATNPLIAVTATHSYDAAGQRISTSYTGGGTRSYSFDGLGRITNDTLRNTTNTVTAAFDIGYDPDSNIVRRTITLPGNSQQGVHTYGYDNVGRITSWTRPGVAAVPYAWDGSGNLTNHAGVTQTFDQRNRILTSGSTVWTWTPRGTMATQQVGTAAATTVSFDGLNRMTGSSGQAFAYDGLGRVITNGATAFSYAGFEIDPVAVGTTLIARGPWGEPVSARIGTAAATMLGVDTHQDVTYRFAGAGTVSATRLYEPFGKPTVTSGTMPVIGFQGDYTNPTTGDVWMGARWYKPGTGSFTARDTVFGKLDTPISLNRYTYAWADPLGMWDPDGRCPGVAYVAGVCISDKDENGDEEFRDHEQAAWACSRMYLGNSRRCGSGEYFTGGRESHSRDRSESVESCETDVSRCGPSWGLQVGGFGASVGASSLVAAAAPYIAAAAVGVVVGCALTNCVKAIKETVAQNKEIEANDAWLQNYIQQAVNEGSMPPGVYGGRSYEREGDDQPGVKDQPPPPNSPTAGFGGLSRAEEFGVLPYNQLKADLKGTGLQAHHLIEQRFAKLLGQSANKMLSVAVTPEEHQLFTNAWRKAIPYGEGTRAATPELVTATARQVYADYPEILEALGLA